LAKIIQQAGVIPFLFDRELKILLITSKMFPNRWVLPKGHIEKDHSPRDTALREALEEAGINGKISEFPVGEYDYHKFDRSYHVLMYMLEITEKLDEWPEKTQEPPTAALEPFENLERFNVREIDGGF
jgi:8-oxo-dGTP pyrophosphatase MutT (NUDIX family)